MASGYAVQPDIEIHIESVDGDLVIEGRAEAEIRARGDDLDLHIEEDGRHATVSSSGDCRLRVPNRAQITINAVGADARITEIVGSVTVENVGADLVIRDTGAVQIGNVGADLELKRIKGNAEVNHIGADASFREIAGDLRVSTIGAGALITGISGSCDIDVISAELVLKTQFASTSTYRFASVGSDVLTRLENGADVRFVLPHHTARQINIRNVRVEEDGETASVILGSGKSTVTFENIGGEFALVQKDQDEDDTWFENIIPDNLDEVISAQINAHLTGIRVEAERNAERAREKAERIAEKARRNAEHMRREAERNAERARRHSQRHEWGFEFSWPGAEKRKRGPFPPVPPIPPMPPFMGMEKRKRGAAESVQPPEPVTNEERMTILRMVENKQITVEEAERLLSALEGQE